MITNRTAEIIELISLAGSSFLPWKWLRVDFNDLCHWPERINIWDVKGVREKPQSTVSDSGGAGSKKRDRMSLGSDSQEDFEDQLDEARVILTKKPGRGRPRIHPRAPATQSQEASTVSTWKR